ncbi:aspartic proteinase CDR1-like [Nymphaea colorata]|nr:aspartic proteinase CDR1-like [Nymphaea colorata]
MPGSGEYLMKLSLGTPSRLYWATLDTGSNLIWTTCRPCDSCSSQTSMFDPFQLSTYKSQSCSTSSCMEVPHHGCTINQLCGFRYSYGDKSFIEGAPKPALLELAGLVGLGSAQIRQGHSQFSGKEEVQETPMAPGGSQGTYYVLNLTDISIANSRLNIQFGGAQTTALLGDARSIIIDSGTALTYLAEDVYDQVANAVANFINHERLSPPEQDLLCYHVKNNGDPYEGLPEMTFHFVNADLKLPPSNIFRMFASGIACLTIKDGRDAHLWECCTAKHACEV